MSGPVRRRSSRGPAVRLDPARPLHRLLAGRETGADGRPLTRPGHPPEASATGRRNMRLRSCESKGGGRHDHAGAMAGGRNLAPGGGMPGHGAALDTGPRGDAPASAGGRTQGARATSFDPGLLLAIAMAESSLGEGADRRPAGRSGRGLRHPPARRRRGPVAALTRPSAPHASRAAWKAGPSAAASPQAARHGASRSAARSRSRSPPAGRRCR